MLFRSAFARQRLHDHAHSAWPDRRAAPTGRQPAGWRRGLRAAAGLLAALAWVAPLAADPAGGMRVRLDDRTFDSRAPAPGDLLDCQDGKGPCQAVLFPRVMADEKVAPPRGKPVESLRFLSLKGIRAQGGDPILSLALYAAAGGDSVYADLNDDEDLGNDGPGRFWPRADSCLSLERSGGGEVPLVLCRAGGRAKAWQSRCEGIKSALTWALCDEDPFRARLLDIRAGWLDAGGKHWWLGLNDADGDGRYLSSAADRLVVDWDADGSLEKSPDADGIVPPPGGGPLRFSLDSSTYEVAGADEKGTWIDLKRLDAFDPAAAAPRAAEGRPAPDLRFVNMDGDTLRLSDFRGKKVLLHFWSTLCKPCLDNLEGVRSFWKGFGGKNWQVLSLTTDTDLPDVQQAVLKRRMDWMVGMVGPEARRYYANRPLPVLVKIDEKGMVGNRNLILGPRSF